MSHENWPTTAYTDMYIYYIVIIVDSYVFRESIVVFFMGVFFEGMLHRTLKQFTNMKC